MRELRIAVYVDVDNCGINLERYNRIMSQIRASGKVVYAKFYGVSDTKHRDIVAEIDNNGFDIARAMRNKKRNSKVFDYRMAIDAIEYVALRSSTIDAIAVVGAGNDMVPLFSKLATYEIKIFALETISDDCNRYIDVQLDIGEDVVVLAPRKVKPKALPKAKPATPVVEDVQPNVVETVVEVEKVEPVQVFDNQAEMNELRNQLVSTQQLLREAKSSESVTEQVDYSADIEELKRQLRNTQDLLKEMDEPVTIQASQENEEDIQFLEEIKLLLKDYNND